MFGQLMWSPAGAFNVAFSQVQPSSIMIAEVPDIMPPVGQEWANVIPFDRVTGMISESGL